LDTTFGVYFLDGIYRNVNYTTYQTDYVQPLSCMGNIRKGGVKDWRSMSHFLNVDFLMF